MAGKVSGDAEAQSSTHLLLGSDVQQHCDLAGLLKQATAELSDLRHPRGVPANRPRHRSTATAVECVTVTQLQSNLPLLFTVLSSLGYTAVRQPAPHGVLSHPC